MVYVMCDAGRIVSRIINTATNITKTYVAKSLWVGRLVVGVYTQTDGENVLIEKKCGEHSKGSRAQAEELLSSPKTKPTVHVSFMALA